MKSMLAQDPVNSVKIVGANGLSWFATIASFQMAKDALQIAALLGSIAVSIASVWWIRRQASNADKK